MNRSHEGDDVTLRTFATSLLVGLLVTGVASAQPVDKLPHDRTQRLAQAPALAAASHIEVLVLDATTGGGGVAPSLAGLPQLRQPPFNTYTQITEVSRATLALTTTSSTASLPNNGSARITLGGRTAEGRYTVNVALTQGTQTSNIQFVAATGEPFFTVRARGSDHAIIYGFIVRP